MITISDLTVSYGSDPVLSGVNLTVERGEFVTLLGASGCGKSTLLRTVAGFVPATAGRIEIDGVDVTRHTPEERRAGFVFQNYALFPHLSVRSNVEFGLRGKRLRRTEMAGRVDRTLETTGLTRVADAMPAELSGGQQQRVAIARVLATEPSVLLMDEPLSNLDANLRDQLRTEIQRMHRELGITTLYVTHDQEEALALSDRVAVMRDGRFEQIDTPHAVYHSPATPFVCDFVGNANVVDEDLLRKFGISPVHGFRLYLRPERVRIDASTAYTTRGTVTAVTFLGPSTRFAVTAHGATLTGLTDSAPGRSLNLGDSVSFGFNEEDAIWLTA